MSWDQIYGHDEIRQQFRNAVESDRLASTFLFVGLEGIGKRTFALKLAQTLLCPRSSDFQPCETCPSCKQLLAGDHPDLEYVHRLPEKNQIALEQLIGDKSNRQGLCQKIAMKPFYGGRKIAILDDADDLRQEGANALLKTLEEPPPGALIILIGISVQRQLPTIRSRSQVIRFSPLQWQQVDKVLSDRELVSPPELATRLAKLSGGSVQNALMLFGEEILEFRSTWIDQLGSLHVTANDFVKTLQSFVDQAGKDASSKRRRIIQIATWASEFYRQVAFAYCGAELALQNNSQADQHLVQTAQNCARRWTGTADHLTLAIDRCLEAEAQVMANAHTATMLESWLVDLNQIANGQVPPMPSLASGSPLSF